MYLYLLDEYRIYLFYIHVLLSFNSFMIYISVLMSHFMIVLTLEKNVQKEA